MPEAFYAVAVLACPVGMGLMMWFMMRGDKQPGPRGAAERSAQPSAGEAEVAELRAEVDQLRSEHRDGYRRGDVEVTPNGAEPR